tara:strand:- start:2925 stop:4898 length:1974 start_codon:yes stop_codon:yes gene_type:complete
MGNKKFNLTKLALAVGVTVGLAGCFSDNDNNVEIKPPVVEPPVTEKVVQPPVSVEKQAGSVTIVVVDALGQALPDTAEATITFKSEENLLSTSGEAITEDDKKTTSGSFGYTIGEIPDAGLTYEFTVTATGYLSNTLSVSLDSDNPDVAQQIKLTPRTLDSANIAVVASTKTLAETAGDGNNASYNENDGLVLTDSDGNAIEKITLPVAVKEDQAAKAAGGVDVSLKNGTKFLDKDGNALQSAPSLTVAYFANEATASATSTDDTALESSSLDAFPGGLGLTLPASADRETALEGNFTTGGFVAIELTDDAGNKVKTFGKDSEGNDNTLEVAMKVDKNTSNPCPVKFDGDIANLATFAEANGFKKGACTLENVAPMTLEPGHIFPVWSYEESTGEWSFENYGLVAGDKADAKKTYDVTVQVKHLSYWNLDFFTYIINAEKCDNRRLSFDIVDSNDNPSQVYADVLVEANSYRLLIGAYNRTNLAKGTFRNPPSFPVKLKMMKDGVNILDGVTLSDGSTLNLNDNGAASGVSFSNLCDLNGGKLKLTTAPASNIVKPLTPQFVCSNNDAGDVPATPVTTPTIAQLFRGGRFVKTFYPSGQFEVSLEAGDTAAYTVRYKNPNNNTWFTQAIEANTTAATLDIPVTCTINEVPVTGTGGS